MNALTKFEVISFLELNLKDWNYDGASIKREFNFKSFVEAFSFMTAVALEAEKLDHHPDWRNVYNKVAIILNTHSVNGITQLDFDLAMKADSAYRHF